MSRTPRAAGWPPGKALILTPGRAGSELLVRLLDVHPRLVFDGEILSARSTRSPSWFVERRALLRTRLGRRASVYGWKALTNDLWWRPKEIPDAVGFLRQFTRPGSLLIVLRRRNYLNQALSFVHAERSQFHFSRSQPVTFERFEVEPELLLATMYHYERHDRWLVDQVAELPHLELFYEDALASPQAQRATADRIFRALDVGVVEVSTDLVSVAPASPLDRLSNRDAVCAALAGTRYESFL